MCKRRFRFAPAGSAHETIQSNLLDAVSDNSKILSAQVYIDTMGNKSIMDEVSVTAVSNTDTNI